MPASFPKKQPVEVILRPIEYQDLERITHWLEKDEIRDNLLIRGGAKTIQEEEHWFAEYKQDSSKKIFAIVCKNQHIGNVSLFNIDNYHKTAKLSIFIGETEFKGKGIGKTALDLLFQLGFSEMGLEKIWLEVLPENLPAIRSYQKCGMNLDGKLRSHYLLHGQRKDILVFSILSREFSNVRKSEKSSAKE